MKKLLFITICFLAFQVQSQVSTGGVPLSFDYEKKALFLDESYQTESFLAPDLSEVQIEDKKNEKTGKPYRAAINLPINLSIQSHGTWTNLPDGSKLWRLGISIPGAKAIGIYLGEKLTIPVGGKLHAYNGNKSHFIGAYTHQTDGFTAMEMVQGDLITLEYYMPKGQSELPTINISKAAYFYRGLGERLASIEGSRPLTDDRADACQVDVACSEITGWEAQRDAVVKYTFMLGNGTFLCSGALMNNTSEDCTPYILTANHCGEPTSSADVQDHVWYFNYQRPTCSPGNTNPYNGAQSQTMSGGFFRASSQLGSHIAANNNQVSGTDFALLELNDTIPSAYNPFYAGWSRSTSASASGVGIHHPAGDEKKVSTYNASLTTDTYNGGWSGAHWRVFWNSTTNGHGVTEGGSSGSPIFNVTGKIVGFLSGGSSSCLSTSSPDLYGKFNRAWSQDGTNASSQLRPWLDPTSTGVTTLDGSYTPCASQTVGYCPASSVDCDEYITDVSFGGITNTTQCDNYSFYWENNPGQIGRGLSYFLQISTGVLGSTNLGYMGDQIGAWIDWNADGDFLDVGELVYTHVVDANSTLPLQTIVTVPQNAPDSDFRMRVRIMFDVDTEGPITPCGTSNYGEVEDYLLTIDGNLAISNATPLDQVSIYPNPSAGAITIDLGGNTASNGTVIITDMTGKRVMESAFNASLFDLNLSDYAKGLYLVNLQLANQTIVRKIIVE